MSRKLDGANFASILTPRPRFYTDPGSREAIDYEIQIDKKGHKTLKEVGTHDIYQEIQSYKEECTLENIIARATAGDTSALNARMGYYADITNQPKDLTEAQNSILKLANGFKNLPAEIREKFDNSESVFVHEFGTEEWYTKMGFNMGEGETVPTTEKIEIIPGTKDEAKPLTPEE